MRNLCNMRGFYLAYKNNKKMQPLAAEIRWSENVVILYHRKPKTLFFMHQFRTFFGLSYAEAYPNANCKDRAPNDDALSQMLKKDISSQPFRNLFVTEVMILSRFLSYLSNPKWRYR